MWDFAAFRLLAENTLLREFEALFVNAPEYVALFLLLALAALASVLLWNSLRKTQFSPLQYGLWLFACCLTRFLWRTEFRGREHLQHPGGAVIVSNHRSSVDPFFVQTSTVRKVHWMVAREFVNHWAFAPLLRACEVIGVGRGGVDTNATRTAIRLVAEGGLVGMFPEGRINMTERLLQPVRPGAALVALKARAVIIPCYIEGSPYRRTAWSPFFMPARVKVTLGEPISLAPFFGREQESGVLEEVMRLTLRRIGELAGQTDFQPEFAGRSWKPTAEQLAADMDAADRRKS